MEHWLPFYYDKLSTLFDYAPGVPIVFEHLAREAMAERHKLILDHFDARRRAVDAPSGGGSVPYKPVAPGELYLEPDEVFEAAGGRPLFDLNPFDSPPDGRHAVYLAGSKRGRSFETERNSDASSVFDAAVSHIGDLRKAGKKVLLAAWSAGSLDRMMQVLAEHGLGNAETVSSLSMVKALSRDKVTAAVISVENGFETDDLVVIAEQDILGDRLIRRSKRKKRGADFIIEATGLTAGDIVVHVDHGIGRFTGLKTIEAAGAPHDCLEILYAGEARLFLPVENIELLSRYGSEGTEAVLDRLGGGAWQARKAKLKKRLLDMAGQLIRIAAERQMREAPALVPPDGLYGEFSARFPYEETDDQLTAIESVIDDLGQGRPMDRLICGDVGFGKTEVALRAAFVAALNGVQVAVVVPTTLLVAAAFQDLFRAVSWPAHPGGAGLPAGAGQGFGGGEGGY